MKVRTFDMLTGQTIECDLVFVSHKSLAKLRTPEGKMIVRKMVTCSYDGREYEDWVKENLKTD